MSIEPLGSNYYQFLGVQLYGNCFIPEFQGTPALLGASRPLVFILLPNKTIRKRVLIEGAKARDLVDDRKLQEVTADPIDEVQREVYLKALPVQLSMLMEAPMLLAVCFRMKKPLHKCRTLYDLNNFASVWACIANILLAMAAEGLFGVTYVPKETKDLKNILGVPDDYEKAALIPIGYPDYYRIKQKPVLLENKIHIYEW